MERKISYLAASESSIKDKYPKDYYGMAKAAIAKNVLKHDNWIGRFIINNKVSEESRLVLLKSLAIVIRNGMSIIGVNTPKIM